MCVQRCHDDGDDDDDEDDEEEEEEENEEHQLEVGVSIIGFPIVCKYTVLAIEHS